MFECFLCQAKQAGGSVLVNCQCYVTILVLELAALIHKYNAKALSYIGEFPLYQQIEFQLLHRQ